MQISVINLARNKISDADLLVAIRAINQQIELDFRPYWDMGGVLRLEGSLIKQPRPNVAAAVLRGDAVVYVSSSTSKEADAEGFHDRNFRGIPYGVVYTEISEQHGDPWSVTFSHEVLELIADPQGNTYVMGPHPKMPRKKVFYWFEMCDPVSGLTYEIDGVALQNFVLPAYFEPPVPGGRTNFLGADVPPFGVAPNSYVGYYDPETQSQEEKDPDAGGKKRRQIRRKFAHTRSARRHKA